MLLAACSAQTRSIFFDLPPPSAEDVRQAQLAARQQTGQVAANGGAGGVPLAMQEERPAIEAVQDWELAREQLPQDAKGGVDWTAALDQALVKPRPPVDDEDARYAAAFRYDFIIEGEKPKFDALFPHSAHTGWLGCQNCHTSLYPYQRNPAKMKDMRKGESCGKCHGPVAFDLKQCKRCHVNM